jgi:hypothetical protein
MLALALVVRPELCEEFQEFFCANFFCMGAVVHIEEHLLCFFPLS